MARRKTLFRMPFLRLKINRQTVFNIFGFLLLGGAAVILISFVKNFTGSSGRFLGKIHDLIVTKFGIFAIFTIPILILFSGHFFNSRKLKFIKLNVTLGIILIFTALLGLTKSGTLGQLIFENLMLDFSIWGAIVILTIMLIIGLVLFLDTSVDVFILFIWHTLSAVFSFLPKLVLRTSSKQIKDEQKELESKQEFIQDKKLPEPMKSPVSASSQMQIPVKPIAIKPLSTSNATWVYPPLSLLADVVQGQAQRGDVKKNAQIIEQTLDSFGIRARVSEINYGPAVTQYALEITMGTKLSKITALGNDLALALAAPTGQVRIEAPIPGRSLVGIEIPNKKPEIVTLKKLLSSSLYSNNVDPLLVPLGLDVSGQPQVASIEKMPHILIAGTTGSGKSVLLNSWISTFLFRTKPEQLRLILVDPKRVELTLYNGIPHLLTEVVVEAKEIISALRWTVAEMEARYREFAKVGARNLESYNSMRGNVKKPYIIFIIDELADLMIFAPGDAEELITRIAQMARATGIHLLLATQRPSVDVITGLMKANIPTRVAFNVSSMIDSRVIIDMPGAEKLLGKGDMLYLPPDQAKPRRIQGPFITEKEVNQLVKFLKAQNPEVHYTEEVTTQDTFVSANRGGTMVVGGDGSEKDVLFEKAVEIISQFDKASASLLQRRLAIGYARAARLLDQLEQAGYVSPAEGSKPREVIKRQVRAEEG